MQQSPDGHQFLGLDIGNSGLRLTELDVNNRMLGATTRITWQHGSDGDVPHAASPAERRARYQPDDQTWLHEIESYLAGKPATWLISSVRRDALNVLIGALSQRPQHSLHTVQHSDVPMSIHVDQPDRLGIDRLLAAFAASSLTTIRPLIVIQAGSAVTVDLVSDQQSAGLTLEQSRLDSFEGGAIIPGVPMMLRLLGKGTDQLPELHADELVDLPPLPGRNTAEAMLCGAASALLGGILHLVERYRHNFGKEVPVILSGGDGMRIAPHIPKPLVVKPHLVQEGLMILSSL